MEARLASTEKRLRTQYEALDETMGRCRATHGMMSRPLIAPGTSTRRGAQP